MAGTSSLSELKNEIELFYFSTFQHSSAIQNGEAQ